MKSQVNSRLFWSWLTNFCSDCLLSSFYFIVFIIMLLFYFVLVLYSERRSRREAVTSKQPSQEDMMLVQSIQITDKFGFDKQQLTKSTGYDGSETVFISGDASQGFCVNAIGKLP